MKEKPVLFSTDMVKAILAGEKTQTRRVVKLPSWSTEDWADFEIDDQGKPLVICADTGCLAEIPCPYGQAGDQLWVKETFWIEHDWDVLEYGPPFDCGINIAEDRWAKIWYCATDDEPVSDGFELHFYSKKPSVFMPRWASRINLGVTGIRVERVQDISLADIKAEGVDPFQWGELRNDGYAYIKAWRKLWDSINAKRGLRVGYWGEL